MRAQLGVAPDWLTYFGGLADKIEGDRSRLTAPAVLNYTLRGAARRRRRDHPVELADAAHDDGACAGSGRRKTRS